MKKSQLEDISLALLKRNTADLLTNFDKDVLIPKSVWSGDLIPIFSLVLIHEFGAPSQAYGLNIKKIAYQPDGNYYEFHPLLLPRPAVVAGMQFLNMRYSLPPKSLSGSLNIQAKLCKETEVLLVTF